MLVNWGYVITDTGIRKHLRTDLSVGTLPYPSRPLTADPSGEGDRVKAGLGGQMARDFIDVPMPDLAVQRARGRRSVRPLPRRSHGMDLNPRRTNGRDH